VSEHILESSLSPERVESDLQQEQACVGSIWVIVRHVAISLLASVHDLGVITPALSVTAGIPQSTSRLKPSTDALQIGVDCQCPKSFLSCSATSLCLLLLRQVCEISQRTQMSRTS
jgi:hypothetical protein